MVFARIFNLKLKNKSLGKGITLVEILVVVFLIIIFSSILISDFPKIKRQFALSREAYRFAQDLRRTQDLGLSGITTLDASHQPVAAKGYGIYIVAPGTQYVIYADILDPSEGTSDKKYTYGQAFVRCDQQNGPTKDCVIDTIDVSKDDPSVYIEKIITSDNSLVPYTSVNFSPPNPNVNIDNLAGQTKIGIVFGLNVDASSTRIVWVNTSGLILVQ